METKTLNFLLLDLLPLLGVERARRGLLTTEHIHRRPVRQLGGPGSTS